MRIFGILTASIHNLIQNMRARGVRGAMELGASVVWFELQRELTSVRVRHPKRRLCSRMWANRKTRNRLVEGKLITAVLLAVTYDRKDWELVLEQQLCLQSRFRTS